MATNSWVDGNKYYVGADGAWIPNYSAPSTNQKPSTNQTPSTTTPAKVDLSGRWRCLQVTTTGIDGWIDLPTSEQSKNYIEFNTSNKTATVCLNGTMYYGNYSFDYTDKDGWDNYTLTLDTDETLSLGAHHTNGMLMLIHNDDSNLSLVYMR